MSSPNTNVRAEASLTLEALQSFEPTAVPEAELVSLIELIGNPKKYDGKPVLVVGFLRLEFEGNALYVHEEDYVHAILKNAVWVERPEDFSMKQDARVNKQYVICEGIFRANETGHFGMFSGSLTKLNRLEPWRPVEH